MGLKLGIVEHEYDKLFPEDMKLFYEIIERFTSLTDENFAGAFKLSKDAVIMADRFSNLSLEASKLVLSSKFSRSEIREYVTRKYDILTSISTLARMIWARGVKREGR
jgi:hypothetical protein